MEQKKQEQKVVMLSILGMCFAFLGWSDVISDYTYKKFSQVENIVLLISILGFIHSSLCVIANLVVIKISHKNPQKFFNKLLLICSFLVIIVGISVFSDNIYTFSICYIIYGIFVEILSMYHFAFETSATERNRYIGIENKRKTIFKIIQCIATIISNVIIIRYFDFGFFITTIIASIAFLYTYLNVRNINCRAIKKEEKKERFLQKLKIGKYSTTIKKYGLATIITRFALSNIIVLFSMHLLENNIEFTLLKEIKNYAVIFAVMAYFIVKKANMNGIEIKTTIFLEMIIILVIILAIWNPYFLILLMGLYTIDNLVEISGRFRIFENDTYPENNVEKNSIMDIGIFTAQALSSVVLLNIPFNISIFIVSITTILAIILKIQCQKDMIKVSNKNE